MLTPLRTTKLAGPAPLGATDIRFRRVHTMGTFTHLFVTGTRSDGLPPLAKVSRIILKGKVNGLGSGGRLTVDGVPSPVGLDGAWQAEIPLPSGPKTAQLEAVTSDGRTHSKTVTVNP